VANLTLAPRTDATAPQAGGGARHYLMCPPRHFDVVYRINPWMHPQRPVDQPRAQRQWEELHAVLESLGHHVEVIDPQPGLPDMVFAANSGLVIGTRAVAAKMAKAERRGEEEHYRAWFRAHGVEDLHVAAHPNEGEGDFLLAGDRLLAGTGFRTTVAAHEEVARIFGVDVVTLHLVDPRWYHLDTALFALDDATIAYYPGAFSRESREVLQALHPGAVVATTHDALAFGLNSISDGRHVILSPQAEHLAADVEARGFVPVPVDMSELHRAGGSAKCCVLELHQPICMGP
jgi:N-dimethylarginine dimethylaminohydrolase